MYCVRTPTRVMHALTEPLDSASGGSFERGASQSVIKYLFI